MADDAPTAGPRRRRPRHHHLRAHASRWRGLREREWGLRDPRRGAGDQEPGTQQTRAVKALRARSRVALTGTPVENRLADLWSLFDFLNPGLLGRAGRFAAFAERLGAARRAATRPLRELVRPYILRRLKTDRRVIADLPDKTEVSAFCGLTQGPGGALRAGGARPWPRRSRAWTGASSGAARCSRR